ncbi:hypothetical protein D2N39_21800 [Gemmobacter lutimaris]|uniref:Uncharacterized protein n=2 Tax=Gemmobacter TaxID=204456 RepID=A0A398BMG4_9RHOB|nr:MULTISPECIES: hypothetical protein [Gemmobacter]PTX47262.1 hypothetical protein C8N34_11318 [Gemmobacter caeni]RID89698.1 hypothetical protein D2N39_21800 [Gemmobacter lutimaris]TWI96501.1 hypothetical protein IQ03_03379 [Gemmobacter caeni]
MPRKDKTRGFFRDIAQPPSTAQERTDAAVKLIRETEADTRAELTARLRAARIAREGTGAASAASPVKAKARD